MAQPDHVPFNALRVVDAVVRGRSYSSAGQELSVTHSAVSQTIKRIETELGIILFERKGNEMQPTPAALQLSAAYASAVKSLQSSIENITHGDYDAR